MGVQISEHFSLAELTVTSQVDDYGKPLENIPGPAELHNLRMLCVHVLEPVRALLGCPMRVTSGFRSHAVEVKVSGKDYGQHRLGQAADWVPLGMEVGQAAELIWRAALTFDQMILEYQPATGARWIHVSYTDARPNRQMALYTADGGKTYPAYSPAAAAETLA